MCFRVVLYTVTCWEAQQNNTDNANEESAEQRTARKQEKLPLVTY